MKVCYFGTYESKYPRNSIIIKGLRLNSVEVLELHQPVWEKKNNKTGSYFKIINLSIVIFKILNAYFKLIPKFIKSQKADVIITGNFGNLDTFLVKLLTLHKKIPIVFNPNISLYSSIVEDRSLISEKSVTAKVLLFFERVSYKISDIIVVDTEQQRKYFNKWFNIPLKKLEKVYVGADTDIFNTTINEKENISDEINVEFRGKFIPLQGVGTIIKAAKLLEHDNVKFHIYGTGQMFNEVIELYNSLNIKNVTFYGWIGYEKLPYYIKQADISLGIFGSTQKARRVIPHKIYQAIAMQQLVITGRTPAIEEVFTDKEDMLFCNINDPQALADAVLTLKNNPDLCRRIAQNAHEKFKKRFTNHCLGRDIKKILEKIIEV